MMTLHILGCGSASPTVRHLPACQVLEAGSRLFMIDCGEGAAHSMLLRHLKFSRLDHIYLSHLHADHCMGLPGIVNTLAMNGRTAPLTIHTFAEGERIFREIFSFFSPRLPFPLVFDIIAPGERRRLPAVSLPGGGTLEAAVFPLRHRVEASGFLFSHTATGEPVRSYAYCSDTVFMPELAAEIRGVDLLYHEATYASDRADKAPVHFHSTAAQAAVTAREAGAGALLLGHFASSYRNEEMHLAEARTIFPRTLAAFEGMRLTIPVNAGCHD